MSQYHEQFLRQELSTLFGTVVLTVGKDYNRCTNVEGDSKEYVQSAWMMAEFKVAGMILASQVVFIDPEQVALDGLQKAQKFVADVSKLPIDKLPSQK